MSDHLANKKKALETEQAETEKAIARQQQVLNGLLELRQRQIGAQTQLKELMDEESDVPVVPIDDEL